MRAEGGTTPALALHTTASGDRQVTTEELLGFAERSVVHADGTP
jgi:hypothetical protein